MELRKLATVMDNAKDELKKGVTANFEKEILNQSFKEFADLHYILTGEVLGVMQFMEYRDWLDWYNSDTKKEYPKKIKTPF
ncbi:hypothetical protein G6R40_06790 [Chryseobacterium sp. POL2]|uniref:hypothetical protein n=1 Tax=Chryseobacterium sp. POL2 TaxID=2713414 RepID=UPI0013E16316|nr:hypothetical protein [Chryseobacterium sp. POL2]QIG89403.1 hypothetical protein G6R40_06790 [Chryseobacterium sp. POL2]